MSKLCFASLKSSLLTSISGKTLLLTEVSGLVDLSGILGVKGLKACLMVVGYVLRGADLGVKLLRSARLGYWGLRDGWIGWGSLEILIAPELRAARDLLLGEGEGVVIKPKNSFKTICIKKKLFTIVKVWIVKVKTWHDWLAGCPGF